MTRILIVDDEPEHTRSLSRAFDRLRSDVTVLTSGNGRQALQHLQNGGVDLVLTDLRMPEMDGFELLTWLREHRPDIPAFSMSAHGALATTEGSDDFGAIGHFHKPVEAEAVLRSFTETLHQTVRGHVQNVSLASFLQVLEMERKTCTLTVTCAEKSGTLAVKNGALVGARSGEIEGEAAAIAIVAWPYPNIGIARKCEPIGKAISVSLGFIVMESMRLQDEAARFATVSDGRGSAWPAPRRTWRPGASSDGPTKDESSRPRNGDSALPSGARALAVVDTETGRVLRSAVRDDCPVGELARLAAQLLLQESATLRLCNASEGVEELVLSTTSRCDVIRPLSASEFALLIFAPDETNLVMARIELEYFIASHHGR